MFSANEIAGFFNQAYIQSKSMKYPDFFHVDTSSHNLKFDQEMPVWSRDSEIDRISRMNRWNELIFCMLVQIHIAKLFQ